MAGDPFDDAVAEAERRSGISDRDVTASVEHFRAVVRPVCQDWKLVVDGWLGGGSGIPPLTVRRTGGAAAVLKIAEPGSLDGQARVMSAAGSHGYARVLQWDADRGALLLERLGHDLWAEEPTVAGQARVLAPLLQEAWRVPLGTGEPFEGKAAGLRTILADLGPRYGGDHQHALAVAAELAGELAPSERPEVVCHGDPHARNVLRRGGAGRSSTRTASWGSAPTTWGSSCGTVVGSCWRPRRPAPGRPVTCWPSSAAGSPDRPGSTQTVSGAGRSSSE